MRIRSFAVASCLALAALACKSNDTNVEETHSLLFADNLAVMQPADIAVAPIAVEVDGLELPLEVLRDELYRGLAQRRYSPLELSWVDRQLAEAGYRGETPPDALFVLTVTGWDTSELSAAQTITAEIRVRMHAGGTTDGRPLFGIDMEQRMKLDPPGGGAHTPAEFRLEAVRRIAADVLELVPERDPTRAPR